MSHNIKINEISVHRKVNLGNYESIDIEYKVVPELQETNYNILKDIIVSVDVQIINAINERYEREKK